MVVDAPRHPGSPVGWLTPVLAFAAVVVAGGAWRPDRRLRQPDSTSTVRERPARPQGLSRRSARRVERAVPDAIELLVIVVRAGLTTRQAIEHLARCAPVSTRHAYVEAVQRLDRGESPVDALEALPDLLGRHARPVVDLIGPADRYGLPLAPALEQLAAEARRSRRRLDEADARRLPVKLAFPLVVCTLPSFVLLAIAPALLAALSSLGGTAW